MITFQAVTFLVLVFTTFFSNGVQAYIHLEAYPLLAYVGETEFSTYLKEYERRLSLPLFAPYILTLLSNLILFFVRSPKMSLPGLIVAFVLNLAVSVVTMVLATPVYTRCKEASKVSQKDMQKLLRINLLRLGLSTVSSLVVIYLLIGQFAAQLNDDVRLSTELDIIIFIGFLQAAVAGFCLWQTAFIF